MKRLSHASSPRTMSTSGRSACDPLVTRETANRVAAPKRSARDLPSRSRARRRGDTRPARRLHARWSPTRSVLEDTAGSPPDRGFAPDRRTRADGGCSRRRCCAAVGPRRRQPHSAGMGRRAPRAGTSQSAVPYQFFPDIATDGSTLSVISRWSLRPGRRSSRLTTVRCSVRATVRRTSLRSTTPRTPARGSNSTASR